jgi:WhiB family transcriptional regulator, redox-sensing transcriptional regulator
MNSEQLYTKLAEAIKEKGATPCQETDPDLFYAGTDEIASGWQQAVKLCKTCPVIAECRAYSLEADELFGVWGGLTANQRRSIRRGKTSPQLEMSKDLTARPHLKQIAKLTSR